MLSVSAKSVSMPRKIRFKKKRKIQNLGDGRWDKAAGYVTNIKSAPWIGKFFIFLLVIVEK